MDENDIRLLEKNDGEAWDRLVRGFHRVVVWHFVKIGVPTDWHDDLGQVVWAKIVSAIRSRFSLEKCRPGVSLEDALRHYIGAIAANAARDWHRRAGRRRRLSLVDDAMTTSHDGPLPMELEEWRNGLSEEEQAVLTRHLALQRWFK
jgi:DNA-directed RNA polymerase specialized sigma24 family protein